MANRFCTFCGAPLMEKGVFCIGCGNPIRAAAPASSARPDAAAPPEEEKTPHPETAAPPEEEKTPRPETAAPPEEEKTPHPETAAPPEEEKTPRPETAAPPEGDTVSILEAVFSPSAACALASSEGSSGETSGAPCEETPPSARPTGDVPPPPGTRYSLLSAWNYVGIFLLMLLPGINLLLLIIWACGGCRKVQKRSFARGVLLFYLLSAVTAALLWAGFLISQPYLVDAARDALYNQYGIVLDENARTFPDLYRSFYSAYGYYNYGPFYDGTAPLAADAATDPPGGRCLSPLSPHGADLRRAL